ncbi:MAG: hypothetical protein JSR80_04445 [Verrucomicrobia bacterium]|nr:hypothetical protein [Verrucomicrobiota bacterium]
MKILIFLFGLWATLEGFCCLRELEGEMLYRRDRFAWTVSGQGIDVLSELTWRDLNIVGARVGAQAQLKNCTPCLLKVEGMAGWLINGKEQDSDFSESGRQQEFSRSLSGVNGYLFSVSASGGYVISNDPCCRQLLILSLGVAGRSLYLRSFDGVDELFSPAPFPEGLNATYRADWITAYFEVEGRTKVSPCLFLRSFLQIHGGGYFGYGHWVLRDLHFYHEAPGFGVVTTLQALFRVAPRWRLTATLRFEYWRTALGSANFNGAEWKSAGIEVGSLYRF